MCGSFMNERFPIAPISGPLALWPWLKSCVACANWDSPVNGLSPSYCRPTPDFS